ncbi:hypothetical protein BGW39_005904, partial [Mortierella sp. 14UC]
MAPTAADRLFGITELASSVASHLYGDGPNVYSRPCTEPLSNLRDLKLEDWDDIGTEEELLSVFRRCPRLEKISMKWSLLPAGVDGADIGEICSSLRNISYNGQGDIDDEDEAHRDHGNLARESTKVPALSVIIGLLSGRGLDWKDFSTTLSCSLKDLSCRQGLQCSSADGFGGAPPVTPSAGENRIFAQLELFYRQIGRQTNLKDLYLYLKTSVGPESTGELQQGNPAFLGMLALKNNTAGRPGFLDLLGGLSKFKLIGGYIVAETPDYKIPEDAPE